MQQLKSHFPSGKTWFFIIFAWLQCCAANFLTAQSITIDSADSYTFAKAGLSVYATSDKNLTIAEAIQKHKAGLFQTVYQNVFNAGIASKYYWFHFTIKNARHQSDRLIIDIHNSRLNELRLYELSGNDVRVQKTLGDFWNFQERPVFNKDFICPIVIGADESREYFLFINQVGQTLLMPIIIQKEEYYQRSMGKNYILDGIAYGILIFTIVLSILFYISTWYKLYLFYALYILTSLLWFLAYFGAGFQYFWSNFPVFNTISAPAFASVNLLLNIAICDILLNLRQNNHRMYTAGVFAKIALGLTALFPFMVNLNKASFTVNQYYLIVFLTVVIASMIILLISVINNAWKGYEEAKFYFVASIMKASSIFYLALLETGLAPGVYFIERSMQLGILIEIILLIFAVAKRYSNYKQKVSLLINKAHEESRALMAREIHDAVSGALTGISYKVAGFLQYTQLADKNSKDELVAIAKDLSNVQQVARNISHDLTPEYITDQPITDAIKNHIAIQQWRHASQPFSQLFNVINISEDELKQIEIEKPVKLNIFRIVQELITNILRHSEANKAEIIFALEKKVLIVIVQDNGIGMPQTILNNDKGTGLRSIESRASAFNGQITISNISSKEDYKKNARLYNYTIFETGTIAKVKLPTSPDINFADY